MKEYRVIYELKGYGYITVMAENEDDALEEVNCALCGNTPRHEENDWLDQDVLWDIEWGTTDAINAKKV